MVSLLSVSHLRPLFVISSMSQHLCLLTPDLYQLQLFPAIHFPLSSFQPLRAAHPSLCSQPAPSPHSFWTLQIAYGTTENSPVTFMHFPEDTLEQKSHSVGRVMPHTEVSPRPGPPDPTSCREHSPLPAAGSSPGLAWGFLWAEAWEEELGCGRPAVSSCQLNFSAASLPV